MSVVRIYRAIIIDAENRKVDEVWCAEEPLKFMYDTIGCDTVALAVELENRDTVFVDDEGLLKDAEHFFEIEGAPQPFAGNGVIFGCTKSGNTISAMTDLETIREKVKFISRAALQFRYSINGGQQ